MNRFMLSRFFQNIKIALIFVVAVNFIATKSSAQYAPAIWSEVADGWANNSVNTVVFRKNSLVSHEGFQYIAFYNNERKMVLGKRKQGTDDWQLETTEYSGNAADAHNSISIMVDGAGYLHVAWDHHNHPLRYAKGVEPGSLKLSAKKPMMGNLEEKVTYPEFYRLPDGDLLFFYRNGQSGQGNLVINRYSLATASWSRMQTNLIDGENTRNAYWQAFVDAAGNIHISWVWRESPNVASNHDMAYARSADGGKTWQKSTGENYAVPINASTAEYVTQIPQGSELINQTAMYADEEGHPFIASYWRDQNSLIPQYRVLFKTGKKWQVRNTAFRQTAFSLSGVGTKRIPVSRPQLVYWKEKRRGVIALIFRDEERGSRVSVALSKDKKFKKWSVMDLDTASVGSWEPSFDTEWWKTNKALHLFVQHTDQQDAEGKSNIGPQAVKVLQWQPLVQKP